jgi:phosphate transport system substrate-binding protein
MSAFIAFLALAAGDPIPPPPAASPPGLVRVSCAAAAAPVVRRWAAAFHRRRPEIRVEVDPAGSDVAMAALYTGRTDVALIGREATDMEAKAFEWIFHYPPARVEVATGSVGSPGLSPALAILVHRSNRLDRIDLDRLRAAFGAEGKTAATWGDLGAGAGAGARPLHLYGPDAESGTGRFFRQKVLGGSSKMAWDRLTEFSEPAVKGAHLDRAGRRVAAAVARDPDAIGIGEIGDLPPGVKVLALASPGAAASRPDAAAVGERRYPLARPVYAYLNRPSGKAPGPETAAFLRFILSPEGQSIASPYLPLPAARAGDVARSLD